jgi:DnaJ-class molecular chaperone
VNNTVSAFLFSRAGVSVGGRGDVCALKTRVTDCYMCAGKGERDGHTCERCRGTGVIHESVIVDDPEEKSE